MGKVLSTLLLLLVSSHSFSVVRTDVREVLAKLETRYGSQDWSNTRRYLYKHSISSKQVEGVLEILDTLDTNLQVAILQSSPRVLNRNCKTNLQPTLAFLRNLFGDQLETALSRNPDLILSSNIGYEGDALDLVENLLRSRGFSSRDIQLLKRKSPKLFSLSVSNLLDLFDYLDQFLSKTSDLIKLLKSHPELFQLKRSTLEERVEFLATLDIPAPTLFKASNAGVLCLSVTDNLQPKIEFVSQFAPNCFAAHPALLGLRLTNLQTKVHYFKSIRNDLPRRVLERCPAAVSLSLENLQETVDCLRALWGGDNALANRLHEYPNILTLSLTKNLRPTIDFYQQHYNGTKELRGRYLAASLEQRLLPRFHFVALLHERPPPVYILATTTDQQFCDFCNVSLDDYRSFKERNKFVGVLAGLPLHLINATSVIP